MKWANFSTFLEFSLASVMTRTIAVNCTVMSYCMYSRLAGIPFGISQDTRLARLGPVSNKQWMNNIVEVSEVVLRAYVTPHTYDREQKTSPKAKQMRSVNRREFGHINMCKEAVVVLVSQNIPHPPKRARSVLPIMVIHQ